MGNIPGRPMAKAPGARDGHSALRNRLISINIINRYSGRIAMATSYSIGKHFEDMIDGLIKDGRYATASEIIREGLRLVEEREERRKVKLQALREEIQKGFDSGPAEDVGDMFERIKADGRKRLAAKNGK